MLGYNCRQRLRLVVGLVFNVLSTRSQPIEKQKMMIKQKADICPHFCQPACCVPFYFSPLVVRNASNSVVLSSFLKSNFLSPLYRTLSPAHNVAFKNLVKATKSVSSMSITFVICSAANHVFTGIISSLMNFNLVRTCV